MQPFPPTDPAPDKDLAHRFARAVSLFQARDAPAAELELKNILVEWPDHSASLHLLALIAGRDGRDAECVTLLERAILNGMAEQMAASAFLLGAVHERSGRFDGARTAYRRAVAAAPEMAEAHLKLGLLLLRHGWPDAADTLRGAIAVDPNLAVAHSALGSALQALGDLEGAAKSAAHAVKLAPDVPVLLANLAVIRNAVGNFAEAEVLCLRALRHGDEAALLNTLGIALQNLDRLDAATTAFERAVALRPDLLEARYNLGMARKDQGRTMEAVRLLRDVVTLDPGLAAARFALCMAHLPPLYGNEAEIDRCRSTYAAELEALVAHAERAGPAMLASGVGTAQPFYLAYQGRDNVALQQRYGELVCRVMADAFPPVPLAGRPAAGQRIRVGVVSGHFRDHSVWRMPTRGWVEHLDHARFELIGYHTSPLQDAETSRAVALFDRFVQGPLPIEAWRDRIAADRPHALIYPEVGMDPMVAQLAALRLAPVQYASWGHPSTTGYPTLDYFLSSDAMEPDDGDRHYTERLVRLPGLGTPLAVKPFAQPSASRMALGLPPDATVYWCGQSLYKYLPQHDDVFAAITAKVPNSRFLFIEFPGSKAQTAMFRNRLRQAFVARGLDSETVCVWLPRMSPDEFLATLGCADVILDSIGWSGCNSLIDALPHGLPIVTLAGSTMRSRHGAAILNLIGLGHFVCLSKDVYVDVAVSLASIEIRGAIKPLIKSNFNKLAALDAVFALESHITHSVRSADGGLS